VFELLVDKLKKHEVKEFKGWLHTVVKNYCLMQLRSSSNVKTAVLDESRVQFQEEMHHDEIQEKEWQLDNMSKCMEILSTEQKMIIELFYYSDKCYKEISEMTGMDWNKVRSMIQNGKRNLKICMEESKRNETIKKFSR
jgi:RNA polymerase sigma factor (sigma-70 family)